MKTKVQDLGLQPGDILLLRIKGLVGVAVWLMQAINRDLSRWTHAAIVLDDDTVFEAQPGGAVITPLAEYADRTGVVVSKYQSHLDPRDLLPLDQVMTAENRRHIVNRSRQLTGIGYNWGTYIYLALYRFGVRPRWLRDRVQNDDRLICSQACDLIYDLEGVHLFADGRMPYDITPGDLARLA